MHDDVAEINQDPLSGLIALGAVDTTASLLDFVVEVFCQRSCLAVRGAAYNDDSIEHAR